MPAAGTGEVLMGIAGSQGVAVAPALVMAETRVGYPRRRLKDTEVESDWARFAAAVSAVQADLRRMIEPLEAGRPEASILEAYVLMVGDETLAGRVRLELHENKRGAEWAVAAVTEELAEHLGSVEDPYIRERRHDIEFVGERLLLALSGAVESDQRLRVSEPSIVVAHDLSPADTAAMMDSPVLGFVTEIGSRTSHTAIMARALGIPAVVGVSDALKRVGGGDLLVLDGLRGRIVINPDEAQLEEAERRAARYSAMARELGATRDLPAITKDGLKVSLYANIELPDEAATAREHGAEGVGLYRTEYLYVNRHEPPAEEEQLEIFRRVVTSMQGRPVTLRTFDIGGDKFVTTFRLPEELNPMLGLRAVRLALSQPDVFLSHLRAMVRASAFGEVRIMIPMVSTLDELRKVRELFERAKQEVRTAGEPMADDIPLGVMIEVPAAAIMAHRFATAADFMSIGTNDLVQYALAIDRTNRHLAQLASPYEPAILRLIAGVIEAGRVTSCPVSLCGEMASEVFGALVLLGLGLRDLSMESVAIPEIKAAISRVGLDELEQLAARALQMNTAAEVEDLLAEALEPRLHDLITKQPDSIPGAARPISSHPSRR
jgi:phosphotransferase system enzyme I (PtsI)